MGIGILRVGFRKGCIVGGWNRRGEEDVFARDDVASSEGDVSALERSVGVSDRCNSRDLG